MTRNEKRPRSVSFSLTDDDIYEIERVAERNCSSRSAALRFLVLKATKALAGASTEELAA